MLLSEAVGVTPFVWLGLAVAASLLSKSGRIAPKAAKRPHFISVHGHELWDEYAWLRDREDPQTIAYLQAENEYTDAVTQPLDQLQQDIYQEMRGRIQEEDTAAPVRFGPYFYYTKTEQGKQYTIHCRKHRSLHAAEELLLDENQLAEGQAYFRLGSFEVSPDHRWLAYSTDIEGSEKFTIAVIELATKKLLDDDITNTAPTLAWANDSLTLYYVRLDEANRPYQALRHRLGTTLHEDVLLLTESDESYFLSVGATRSRRFVLLHSESKTSAEVHFLEADHPCDPFQVVEPRQENLEYSIEHRGDLFYIVTNWNAVDFRLMTTPVTDPGRSNWRELIPARPGTRLQSVALFRDHMAVFERDQGIRRVWVSDPMGRGARRLEFDEPIYTALPGPNPEFNTKLLRVLYSSLVTPASAYDIDMDTGAMELKKRIQVKGGYAPEQYRSERLEATSHDGRKIPVSIVYKRDLDQSRSHPVYLHGYGAYGICIDPVFNANRLSLLDRGVAVAIAHVRGGEELGRTWYEEGKLRHKRNTFLDFIACAEFLTALGRTNADKLAICGGSAGGLLIGAVINQRPDLFKAAVAHVPFVDLINTMLDPTLPLTVTEYEEWGNPNHREDFEYMLSYSPYDRVTAINYPALLVTAGLNDPRVAYWEPAKWVARLRDRGTGDHPILLYTNLGAGHGGASGRFDRLKEVALDYAFILDQIGEPPKDQSEAAQ